MSAHEQGGRFPRVQCEACDNVCLPEHAPEYVLTKPDTGEQRIARLCRIPSNAAPDGGLLFRGCGPVFAMSQVAEAKLLADPFLGARAAALRVVL